MRVCWLLPFNRTSLELKQNPAAFIAIPTFRLLIEPVWNWNLVEHFLPCTVFTFNRTSLELKHFFQFPSGSRCISFNRTSLELKLKQHFYTSKTGFCLLIEPVWNWNKRRVILTREKLSLLIEPVWNWNVHALYQTLPKRSSFNRTSLELKHGCDMPAGGYACLLIEPVWNWNSVTIVRGTSIERTFNRTSLELKHHGRRGKIVCDGF